MSERTANTAPCALCSAPVPRTAGVRVFAEGGQVEAFGPGGARRVVCDGCTVAVGAAVARREQRQRAATGPDYRTGPGYRRIREMIARSVRDPHATPGPGGCLHPAARAYSGSYLGPGGLEYLWVGCCECGALPVPGWMP